MKAIAAKLGGRFRERRDARRPSGFRFAFADRLRYLNPDDWRAVTAGQSFFFSPAYLGMLETVCPENLEPRYALVADDDGPVAAVCMQLVRVSMAQLRADGGKRPALRSRVAQRVLVCGNLLSYGMHAVCFAPNVDRVAAWPAVAEALYRVRRAEKLGGQVNMVLVKDLPRAVLKESATLARLAYAAVETEPNMVLRLDPAWRSHADYLASLTSKYRSAYRQQVQKAFDESGCEIVALDDAAAHAAVLHELYLQVHGKAGLRPFTLRAGYWSALAHAAGDRLAIHGARRDGRLVGFIATLKDGDTAFAYHIGFDRETAQAGVPLYLRLLHAAVEQSIAFGCRTMSCGRTALEPKARLGCEPEPVHVWARLRQPVLNRAVKPLLAFIQHAEAPEANPFKQAAKPGRGESA